LSESGNSTAHQLTPTLRSVSECLALSAELSPLHLSTNSGTTRLPSRHVSLKCIPLAPCYISPHYLLISGPSLQVFLFFLRWLHTKLPLIYRLRCGLPLRPPPYFRRAALDTHWLGGASGHFLSAKNRCFVIRSDPISYF
jgi:hypothetical protein